MPTASTCGLRLHLPPLYTSAAQLRERLVAAITQCGSISDGDVQEIPEEATTLLPTDSFAAEDDWWGFAAGGDGARWGAGSERTLLTLLTGQAAEFWDAAAEVGSAANAAQGGGTGGT